MDTIYPVPLSQIYRRVDRRKRGDKGQAGRYRTLPVTFSEIQEVDEENLDEEERDEDCAGSSERGSINEGVASSTGVMSSKSDHDLKTKYFNYPNLQERTRRSKPTMKSLNRKLLIDCKPTIDSIPGSPESPIDNPDLGNVPRINFNKPRTSI